MRSYSLYGMLSLLQSIVIYIAWLAISLFGTGSLVEREKYTNNDGESLCTNLEVNEGCTEKFKAVISIFSLVPRL